MRFFVTGLMRYGYADCVLRTLSVAGHEVSFFPMHEFYTTVSYWKRKLYKMGCSSLRTTHEKAWEEELLARVECQSPDVVLVLNGAMLSLSLAKALSETGHLLVLWLWDGVVRFGQERLRHLLPYLSCVAVFEKADLQLLREYEGAKLYLPLGYDESLYEEAVDDVRDIDISFIGMPSEERLAVLDRVAEYAYAAHRTLFVGGTWYDWRFWKRLSFRKRHPALYPFVENRLLTLEEAAHVYRRSRICLNIGMQEHHSVNPRTFELLASGALQIMDAGQNLNGRARRGVDLLQYENMDQMIDLIDYYLADERARQQIACRGQQYNRNRNSMRAVLDELLKELVYP